MTIKRTAGRGAEAGKESTDDSAKARHATSMVFPIGEPNTAYAQYFVGQSYLTPLSTAQVNISNVTFEPGCRNNWHIRYASQGNHSNEWCEPVSDAEYGQLK